MAQNHTTPPRSKPTPPIFLEPQTYRRRRLMDGARLLPALGVMLWMVPLLWPTDTSGVDELVSMSSAMKYIFLVWLGLIVVAGAIWLKARGATVDDADDPSTRQAGPD